MMAVQVEAMRSLAWNQFYCAPSLKVDDASIPKLFQEDK